MRLKTPFFFTCSASIIEKTSCRACSGKVAFSTSIHKGIGWIVLLHRVWGFKRGRGTCRGFLSVTYLHIFLDWKRHKNMERRHSGTMHEANGGTKTGAKSSFKLEGRKAKRSCLNSLSVY